MNLKLAQHTRVLIIDDQVLAKGYMKYSLEELGFSDITYIDRANQALATIRKEHFDLIVCSYNLKKEQEGYYLYDQLKQGNELSPSSAFIFVSADTTPDLVHSIVELQPDDFLAKPFTVKELDKRLSRVLIHKDALRSVYDLMEKGQLENALAEVEVFLSEPDNSEHFPQALKLKGELLYVCGLHEQAKEFYLAILNVQKFTWAQLGLVKSHIQLDEDDDAEKLIIDLAFKPNSQLAAYDLLSALQIKRQDFDAALECVLTATEISPRNIQRHKKAVDLSRITHDYQTQFEAAKKVVKFAKHSILDKPENYLTVARAGIDYAMTAEEGQVYQIIKQANDHLKQLQSNFPKADIQDQVTVINARIMYLEDETENAKALMAKLQESNWEAESIEALLDRAKAFHTLGLHEQALTILDKVEYRCRRDPQHGDLLLHYVKKEKQEKNDIRLTPKELNNNAVALYDQGHFSASFKVFSQAFTIMPKNPSIALNLLQTIAIKAKQGGLTDKSKPMVLSCIKTIENANLNEEQEDRYHKVRNFLKEAVS